MTAFFKNLSLRQKILSLVLIANIVGTAGYVYLSYVYQKDDLQRGIDTKLSTPAYSVSYILPDGFQDKIKDQNSVSPDEYLQNQAKLSAFIRQIGLDDAYTLMQFGNSIVFTADDDLKFFETYTSPPDSLRQSFADGQVRYDQYTDEFGTYRSIFLPATTASGQVFVTGIDIPVSFISDRLKQLAANNLIFGLIILGISFSTTYLIVSRNTKPLKELTRYTKDLVNQNFSFDEKTRGDVTLIHQKRGDEVGKLAGALSQMESTLQKYIVNLKETMAAKGRIESELAIARNIQMGFLPKTFPAFPTRSDFDLHAIIEPALEVGGDLYNYFMLGDHRLFFLIGDVSDKGVPAALFMAVTQTLFRTQALHGDMPINEIMTRVNRELWNSDRAQMFVTAFAGILNLRTGEIIYSDAGHEPPFIMRANGEVEMLKKKGGPALCFFDEHTYQSDIFQLDPGDTVVLYTDGVTEARNADKKLFTAKRIGEALLSCPAAVPPSIITQQVLQSARAFAGNVPQYDDITLLAIRYYGGPPTEIADEAKEIAMVV